MSALSISPVPLSNRTQRRKRRKEFTEQIARHECWRTEALKRCKTTEQRTYVRVMDSYMNTGGEWFAGRARRARCLPPAKDSRGRGRPNKSGHMSLMKLDQLERELVELGVLAPKPSGTTNGHLFRDTGVRMQGIKVLRSANSLLLRALQRFGFYYGRRFRRSKSQTHLVGGWRGQRVNLRWVRDGDSWVQRPLAAGSNEGFAHRPGRWRILLWDIAERWRQIHVEATPPIQAPCEDSAHPNRSRVSDLTPSPVGHEKRLVRIDYGRFVEVGR